MKLTTHAAVANNRDILLESVPSHVMTAASTVVNRVICLGTATSQRNLVGVIALAVDATKLVTLLVIAPQIVEVVPIELVVNATKSATLPVIALQGAEVEETEHVTSVGRSAILRVTVPLRPLVLQLVAVMEP